MAERRGEAGPTLVTISDGPGNTGPAPLFVLRVASGHDSGKSLVLDWNATPRVHVGQSRASELALQDPKVSRRHLALAPHGNGVRMTDLDSTNGTRIGGVRVVEALLGGGETIELGDSAIRLVRAGNMAETPVRLEPRFGRVLGKSQEMSRVFSLAERLATSQLALLIEGETGTGKELLAEAIHDAGPRAGKPFVVYDASSYAGEVELEALSLAIEQAAGGTLVLDEVGDLGIGAQARLAPMLDRAGLHVIATTRRDLERQVDQGSFQESFLFRIAGARLELPPLRQRHGDIELLGQHFWTLYGGAGPLPRTFAIQLARHDWPGNVRELEHAVARRVAIGDELEGAMPIVARGSAAAGGARPGDPDFLDGVLGLDLALPAARQLVVTEFEQRYVSRAIAHHGGNVSRAAAASGLTRRYFHMLRSKGKGRP